MLPPAARAAAESLAIYAPPVGPDEATRERLQVLRVAAEERRMVQMRYLDLKGRVSERTRAAAGLLLLERGVDARGLVRGRARASATSASTASSGWRCWTSASATSPGKTLADLFRQVEGEMAERDRCTDA